MHDESQQNSEVWVYRAVQSHFVPFQKLEITK